MNQIDFKAINDQIEALENKRTKFKVAGICCGVGAIFPIWAGAFGPFFFLAWLAALICGFVFRSVAVKARNEAMRLRLSIANLDVPAAKAPASDTSPALPKAANLATMPAAPKPAAAKPAAKQAQTTASRLDKAHRRGQ